MNIKKNILETIGHTPLVEIDDHLYVKLESFNPAGSVKDRVAYKMIQSALENKEIDERTTIIEATSGNIGIGIAMVCAALHLKCIIVMPDSMSLERRRIIQAFGAELVLSDGKLGMKGAIEKANHLHDEINNSFILGQFTNTNNPLAHFEKTAVELIEDTEGQIDMFVAGIGTGGTISGVGKYLKQHLSNVQIIGVEPKQSAMITMGISGKHKIQGIGAGFIPSNYNAHVVDKVITIDDEDAYEGARELARKYGILAGVSSGAAYMVAKCLSKQEENKDKKIVVLLPDTGERYLSTDLFGE